jgi:hypothetical protein
MSNLPRQHLTSRRLERAAVAVIAAVAVALVALSVAGIAAGAMTKVATALGNAITAPAQGK